MHEESTYDGRKDDGDEEEDPNKECSQDWDMLGQAGDGEGSTHRAAGHITRARGAPVSMNIVDSDV